MSQTIEALPDVIKMDDDNDPSPENIPLANESTTTVFDMEGLGGGVRVGIGCLCRKSVALMNHKAKLKFSVNTTSDDHYLQLFNKLFPNSLLKTIIEKVNEKISGDPVSKGKLLWWIGMWVLIPIVDGSHQ